MNTNIARRAFLGGLAVLPFSLSAPAEDQARFSLPPRANWTEAQEDGRRNAERQFRRKRIPWRHRDRVFEGLVYAVKQGKREAKDIIDEAGRYLAKTFPEVPEWLKWLSVLLSVMASLLTILLLFI